MTASTARHAIKLALLQPLRLAIENLLCITCLLSMGMSQPVQAACPAVCSCSGANGGGQTVSCGPGLSRFPQGLPSSATSISLSPTPTQTQNSIPLLADSDFKSFTNLTWITIRRSNVQHINPSTFSSLKQLMGLDLRDNRLQSLSRSELAGLSSLVTLDISDNRRCTLDADIFKGMTRLRVLRLANIGLDNLGGILNDLASLVHLDLHGNKLFRLRGTSVGFLVNLRHLDISGNDLYGIDEDTKPILSSLAALDMDHNPWRCNCALAWLKSLPRKCVAPSGGGRMPVVCGQPSMLAFRDIWDVHDTEMKCSPARISFCTSPVTVWEGDQISITCDVEGDPFPDVTWFRPDRTQVQNDVTFATVYVVSLMGIRADYSLHHGTWTVKALSYNTTDTMTVQVKVLTLTTTSPSTQPSKLTGNPNNPINQGNNKNISTRKPSLWPGSGSLTNQVGKTVTPKNQASVMTHTQNAGGNSNVFSTASFISPTDGKQQPAAGTHGNGHGDEDNNKDNSNGSNRKNEDKNNESDNDKDKSRNNSDAGITNNTIVVVAIVCGSVVCIVGMTLFALTVYKIRQKRQIHARRRRQSAELYRYDWYGNGGASTVERSPKDISLFVRPSTANNADTSSVRNVSTMALR